MVDTLHLVFTSTDVLLSRRAFADWRAIQDAFPDYKASLGPASPESVIEYLAFDHADLVPSAGHQVAEFLASEDDTRALTFRR